MDKKLIDQVDRSIQDIINDLDVTLPADFSYSAMEYLENVFVSLEEAQAALDCLRYEINDN